MKPMTVAEYIDATRPVFASDTQRIRAALEHRERLVELVRRFSELPHGVYLFKKRPDDNPMAVTLERGVEQTCCHSLWPERQWLGPMALVDPEELASLKCGLRSPDEFIGQLRAWWEACGPWVPDDSLDEEGVKLKRAFQELLADDRITPPSPAPPSPQ